MLESGCNEENLKKKVKRWINHHHKFCYFRSIKTNWAVCFFCHVFSVWSAFLFLSNTSLVLATSSSFQNDTGPVTQPPVNSGRSLFDYKLVHLDLRLSSSYSFSSRSPPTFTISWRWSMTMAMYRRKGEWSVKAVLQVEHRWLACTGEKTTQPPSC